MQIKIATIIGARPQIIKAAALSRAIRNKFPDKINEVIIHTGQHYENSLSKVFFEEMDIPEPDINLKIGSARHGKQTAAMIAKIEEALLKNKPDFVVLYGDTNTTLAGSIAAIKMHIPVVHIEAGLRSFNKTMPEEINRIVCDHSSTLLFAPTRTGVNNLINEGFKPHNNPPYTSDNPGVFHCGDIMFDNSQYYTNIAEKRSMILEENSIEDKEFVLCTIHRDNNTDNPDRLNTIFESLNEIASENETYIVLPMHPRTSKVLKQNLATELYKLVKNNPFLKIIPPATYFDFIVLEKNCKMIITDSGGVQKESYFFHKPCIILRPETEWIEIVKNKTAIIADADKIKILDAYRHFITSGKLTFPPVFGDGNAAEFICNEIIKAS